MWKGGLFMSLYEYFVMGVVIAAQAAILLLFFDYLFLIDFYHVSNFPFEVHY